MIAIIFIPIILLASIIAITTQSVTIDTMDLEIKDLNDRNIYSSSYKGKIQVVEFMATWCTVCEQITNNVGQLFSSNKTPSDVIFWSVSIDPIHDTPEILNDYITKHNVTGPVADGNWIFGRDMYKNSVYYQVTNVPHLFLVDKNLKIVDNHLGLMSQNDIMNWINKLEMKS